MVDINLFKEGEDEKEWGSDSGEGEDEGKGKELDDELKEDLDFEDDISESSPFTDEGLLSDEDAVPDFEESDVREQVEDYDFGEIKEKKTSIWLWFLLGVIVIGVFLYLYVYQPRQSKVTKKEVPTVKKQAVTVEPAKEIPSPTTEKVTAVDDSGIVAESKIAGVFGSVSVFVDASTKVFQNLSQQGQFGTILINGNQFFVEYVSETPGVAQAMGHRIQTLLGTSGFKVSPEERHRTGGQIHYWGVVSGELPTNNRGVTPSSKKHFPTVNSFINDFKGLVQNKKLTIQGIQKLSPISEKGVEQTPVRIRIEGNQTQILSFLNSLKGFYGNYSLKKLLLVPSNYSDFQAKNVKLVLNFTILVG